jgi:hypothetical protein
MSPRTLYKKWTIYWWRIDTELEVSHVSLDRLGGDKMQAKTWGGSWGLGRKTAPSSGRRTKTHSEVSISVLKCLKLFSTCIPPRKCRGQSRHSSPDQVDDRTDKCKTLATAVLLASPRPLRRKQGFFHWKHCYTDLGILESLCSIQQCCIQFNTKLASCYQIR